MHCYSFLFNLIIEAIVRVSRVSLTTVMTLRNNCTCIPNSPWLVCPQLTKMLSSLRQDLLPWPNFWHLKQRLGDGMYSLTWHLVHPIEICAGKMQASNVVIYTIVSCTVRQIFFVIWKTSVTFCSFDSASNSSFV